MNHRVLYNVALLDLSRQPNPHGRKELTYTLAHIAIFNKMLRVSFWGQVGLLLLAQLEIVHTNWSVIYNGALLDLLWRLL